MRNYHAPAILVLALLTACAQEQAMTNKGAGTTVQETADHSTSTQAPLAAAAQGSSRKSQAAPAGRQFESAHSSADAASASLAIVRTPHVVQDREHYLAYSGNAVVRVSESPVSTFSIDVDTAAYSNVRRMLMREGRMPPHDAVRVEEFVNYFDYRYTTPAAQNAALGISTELAPTPWNADSHLLKVGLVAYQDNLEQRPPANLVFLVDVSGSMRSEHKLALVKKSLRLLVKQLDARDSVALVVYAGAAGLVLDATAGDQRGTILSAINQLEAGGGTNGGAGIQLAYDIAAQQMLANGINRVIIASDGDLNVGTTSLAALKNLVERQRQRGIALTTLGFGSGNYNYALMEQLADVGDGNAAYIDSVREAHKVLVNQLGSTLRTVASDVKIQLEFNPAMVSEYRLIGYENRLLAREDFTNDRVDAGDMGAGHSVTALYEISLVGSASERIDSLRYQPQLPSPNPDGDELAFVKLRYKEPGTNRSSEITSAVTHALLQPSLARSSDDFRFAASVAGFGQLLRGGRYTGDWGYSDALELARSSRGPDPHGYRSEMLALLELSRDLSAGP